MSFRRVVEIALNFFTDFILHRLGGVSGGIYSTSLGGVSVGLYSASTRGGFGGTLFYIAWGGFWEDSILHRLGGVLGGLYYPSLGAYKSPSKLQIYSPNTYIETSLTGPCTTGLVNAFV
jgi:hypothetical protein